MDDALHLDYLNGTLGEEERTLFEKHLDACPECRREIDELRQAAAAVAGSTPPPVPEAWVAAAKARLRAKALTAVAPFPSGPSPERRGTNILQYAAIAAGITGGLVLIFGLALGATAGSWIPDLPDALGISGDRAARTAGLVVGILSLHALLFVPSIVDNVYRIVRRGGRRNRQAPSSLRFVP